MSKIFFCCELIERVKQFLSENQSSDEDKYQFLEFLHKSALKITNKRIKEWVNFNGKPEPVWAADYDYLFCEECKKWFKEQGKEQLKLIDAQIEKEKAEGTFHSNPYTQKALEEIKEKADRWEKELSLNRGSSELNFTKSPQEYS